MRDEAQTPPEPWAIPDGIRVAGDVDLAAEDPAFQGSRRRCVALAASGRRCRVNAVHDSILCTAHAGRLDSAAGGRAKAQTLRLVRDQAEARMVEARMGARAVIAARAIERAADLRAAFDTVLDATLEGDKQQARTLLGYLTAAFPDVGSEGNTQPGSGSDLTTLTTAELRQLALGQQPPQSQQ